MVACRFKRQPFIFYLRSYQIQEPIDLCQGVHSIECYRRRSCFLEPDACCNDSPQFFCRRLIWVSSFATSLTLMSSRFFLYKAKDVECEAPPKKQELKKHSQTAEADKKRVCNFFSFVKLNWTFESPN